MDSEKMRNFGQRISAQSRAFLQPQRLGRFAGSAGAIRRPIRLNKDTQIKVLSQLISVMGVLNAAATLPQVMAVFSSQDASSLSLVSWLYYLIFSIVLLAFGVLNRQKPLIITYGSSGLVYALVVLGVILYS